VRISRNADDYATIRFMANLSGESACRCTICFVDINLGRKSSFPLVTLFVDKASHRQATTDTRYAKRDSRVCFNFRDSPQPHLYVYNATRKAGKVHVHAF